MTEALVGLVLAALVFGLALGLWSWTRRHAQRTLGVHLELQLESRRALLDIITELQESVEFVRPAPGTSLSYLVCRDKLNRLLTLYAVRDPKGSERAGRAVHQLYLHRAEPGAAPPPPRTMVSGVERVAFTALSPAVVQIRLDLFEQGRSYPVITAVRARNVLAGGDR